jgi:hypothetical protein
MDRILFACGGVTSKFLVEQNRFQTSLRMKKGDRIEAYVKSLNTGSIHDPCYEGYFVCFNEQQYYEAHDVLEHLWLGSAGPEHRFFKGLIQFAGAFVHLQKQYRRPEHPTDKKRLHPAWRLFKLAHLNLEPFCPWYLDLDVGSVLDLCSRNILELEKAQFQFNPWNPAAAPTLSLRGIGGMAPDDFRDCLTDEPQ